MNFLILNSVNLGQGLPQNLKKNILLLVVFPSENILNIWTQIFDSHLLRWDGTKLDSIARRLSSCRCKITCDTGITILALYLLWQKIVRGSPPRHSAPPLVKCDIHHPWHSPPLTFTTPYSTMRHSPPRTFTTTDIHHHWRSSPQTFTSPDIHHPYAKLRHSPPTTSPPLTFTIHQPLW